jgi:hypothetical protein
LVSIFMPDYKRIDPEKEFLTEKYGNLAKLMPTS